MKKKILPILGMAALFAAASCSVENMDENPVSGIRKVAMTFNAESPSAGTKTSIDPDAGNAVYWTAGDAISVFPTGGGNEKFVLEGEGGSASGSFTGEAAPNAAPYYALYPYDASATLSGTTINATLPSTQYSTTAGTFDTMLAPAVAVSDDSNNLSFSHVAGLLELNFTNLDGTIKEIQLKAAESMAGAYTVSMSGDTFSAASASSGESPVSVRLAARDGGNLAENGPYYLVLLPGTYTDVQLFITLDNGTSYMVGTLDRFEVKAGELRPQTVDASKATANSNGLYGLFMAGADIYIGGKAYNKDQFTEDGAIRHVVNTRSSIYNGTGDCDGKIFFVDLDPSEENPLSIGNAGDIIVIGVDPDNKPRVIRTAANLASSATGHSRVIFHNLNIDLPNSRNNQGTDINIGFTANSDFGELTLSNCDITMRESSALIQINAEGTTINELNILDCDITMPAGATNRYILTVGTNQYTMSSLNITNNIIHCDDGVAQAFRFINSNLENCQLTIKDLDINNNTLVNLFNNSSTAGIVKELEDASVNKNLIYFNQSIDAIAVKSSYFNFLRPLDIGGVYPGTAYCQDNISYQLSSDQIVRTFRVFSNNDFIPEAGVLENTFRKLSEDPFEDLSTFTLKPEYASYGAQR